MKKENIMNIAFRIALLVIAAFTVITCEKTKVTDKGEGGTAPPLYETVTIAIHKDENTLSPFTYVSSTGTVVNRLIYDTLFTTDLENEIVPWMVADDYQVADDFRSFTFTLLPGQKFHDGGPVSLDDVAFSFTYPKGQNVSSQRRICNQIKDIIMVDDDTMTITLADSDINFLRGGLATMRIISKSQYEHEPSGQTVRETIGSGMYRLSEYKIGEYYTMERVDDYFKGAPQVKRINMPIMENDTVIQQSLLSGDIDAATKNIGVELLDTVNRAEHLRIFAGKGYAPLMMNINNGKAPLDSRDFRLALTHAINVAGIMGSLYGDYATVGGYGIIRPDESYAAPGLDYRYDPARANAILDAAGFDRKNAQGIRLTPEGAPCSFEMLVYSGGSTRIRAAELISEQLKAAGIECAVKVMEMDTVDAFVWPDFDVANGRNYDFSMWGWGSASGINPDFLARLFASDFDTGTFNVCGYSNAAFDRELQEGFQNIKTPADLKTVLLKLQAIVAEDPGLICFGYDDTIQAANITRYSGWKTGKGTNLINIYSFLDK
jgi:peptide/nickel transport system substrate-binding protein